jgi:CMD domain protein
MSEAADDDVMDHLAGLSSNDPIFALRRVRPDVVRYTQTADQAVLKPNNDGGLSRSERAAMALAIANVLRQPALVSHYRSHLADHDPNGHLLKIVEAADPDSAGADTRLGILLKFVWRLTCDPGASRPEHLLELAGAGLSPQAIVALSQLVAFVNYQARVVAGLQMLRGQP